MMYVTMYIRGWVMKRMERKQVYLEADQNRRLRALSRRRGVTESELIRQGVERVLREPVSLPLDHAVWERELRFMEEWARKGPVKGGRTWKREDAYEERLSRRYEHSDLRV